MVNKGPASTKRMHQFIVATRTMAAGMPVELLLLLGERYLMLFGFELLIIGAVVTRGQVMYSRLSFSYSIV